MERKKKEPWRIALAVFSVAFILFLWVKKDIVSIWQTMPQEDILPLIFTTVLVTLFKAVGVAAMLFLIKWAIGKFNSK